MHVCMDHAVVTGIECAWPMQGVCHDGVGIVCAMYARTVPRGGGLPPPGGDHANHMPVGRVVNLHVQNKNRDHTFFTHTVTILPRSLPIARIKRQLKSVQKSEGH